MNRITQEDLPALREEIKRRRAKLDQEAVERELTRPLADPVAAWREGMKPFDELRAERARTRERRLATPRPPSTDEIDERVRAIVAAEKEYIISVVTEAVGGFIGGELKETDAELGKIKREVSTLRAQLADAKMALQTTRGEIKNLVDRDDNVLRLKR
jgi:hypothetical protein